MTDPEDFKNVVDEATRQTLREVFIFIALGVLVALGFNWFIL